MPQGYADQSQTQVPTPAAGYQRYMGGQQQSMPTKPSGNQQPPTMQVQQPVVPATMQVQQPVFPSQTLPSTQQSAPQQQQQPSVSQTPSGNQQQTMQTQQPVDQSSPSNQQSTSQQQPASQTPAGNQQSQVLQFPVNDQSTTTTQQTMSGQQQSSSGNTLQARQLPPQPQQQSVDQTQVPVQSPMNRQYYQTFVPQMPSNGQQQMMQFPQQQQQMLTQPQQQFPQQQTVTQPQPQMMQAPQQQMLLQSQQQQQQMLMQSQQQPQVIQFPQQQTAMQPQQQMLMQQQMMNQPVARTIDQLLPQAADGSSNILQFPTDPTSTTSQMPSMNTQNPQLLLQQQQTQQFPSARPVPTQYGYMYYVPQQNQYYQSQYPANQFGANQFPGTSQMASVPDGNGTQTGFNFNSGFNVGTPVGAGIGVGTAASSNATASVNPDGTASATASATATAGSVTGGTDDNQTVEARGIFSTDGAIGPLKSENFIPKSKLFSLNAQLRDPTLASLSSKVKLSKFQIWWITNKILETLPDKLRPDYVFILQPPFQQGIPAINISQVLASPVIRPEVFRALIEQSSDMLPSQLSVITQRLRLSERSTIRSIMNSNDPSKILSYINPRFVKANIDTIVNTIIDMPETGRHGITSARTKLLPTNVLNLWLQFVNQTRWTAGDFTGITLVGSKYELQQAMFGLTCRDIQTLPPHDIVHVISQFRNELNILRSGEDKGDFPSELRRCMLEKVLDLLAMRGAASDAHILDNLSPNEAKPIGGEVLTAIPSGALNEVSFQTMITVTTEIGHMEAIRLLSFASIHKLRSYADSILPPVKGLPMLSGRSADDTSVDDVSVFNSAPDDSNSNSTQSLDKASNVNKTSSANSTDTPVEAVVTVIEIEQIPSNSSDSTKNATDTTSKIPDVDGSASTSTAANKNSTDATDSTATKATAKLSRRRRDHNSAIEKLNRLGSLYCYSSNILGIDADKDSIKDFLQSKTNIGDRTCCLDSISRKQWNKFLKSVYGSDVSKWNTFDLTSIGDLLISLDDDDLNSISLDTFARVFGEIMKFSGYHYEIKIPGETKLVSFAKGCALSLGGTEGDAFLQSYKNYMKKLARGAEWMLTNQTDATELTTVSCDGLSLAGPAAIGYTVEELQKGMATDEMFECVEIISSVDWDTTTRSELLQFFQDTFDLKNSNLTTLTLIELGNLVTELSAEDAANIPLSIPDNLDKVALLGERINNTNVLKALGTRFMADNRVISAFPGNGPISNVRVVVGSLGNIICGIDEPTLGVWFSSDPQLFLISSPVLGKLEGCTFGTLSFLANHAIRPTNYGQPATWSITDVRTIGVIVAGLIPAFVSQIPADSIEGLTIQAMRQLPTQSVASMTPDQLARLTPEVALVMDPSITEVFTNEQKEAYKSAVAIEKDSFIPLSPSTRKILADTNKLGGFGTDPLAVVQVQHPTPAPIAVPVPAKPFGVTNIDSNGIDEIGELQGRAADGKGASNATTAPKAPITKLSGHADDEIIVDVSNNNTTTTPTETKGDSGSPESKTTQPPFHSEGETGKPTSSSMSTKPSLFIMSLFFMSTLFFHCF